MDTNSSPHGLSPPPVTVDQMLSAGYKLIDWGNFYWNFYVIITGVILGWLFTAKEPWSLAQKSAVSVLFLGFAVVSLYSLWRTFRALNATTSELRVRWETDEPFKQAIVARLSPKGWQVAVCLHALADMVVVYFIWTATQKAP